MSDDKLVEHLESIANAITAFMVVQALAMAATLSANPDFARLAFSDQRLNVGLRAHFFGTFCFACVGMYFFYKSVRRLQPTNRQVFLLLYIGRAIAAALFIAIPLLVLQVFATTPETKPTCPPSQSSTQ